MYYVVGWSDAGPCPLFNGFFLSAARISLDCVVLVAVSNSKSTQKQQSVYKMIFNWFV